MEHTYVWQLLNVLSTVGTRYVGVETKNQSVPCIWATFNAFSLNSYYNPLGQLPIQASMTRICLFSLQMCDTDRNNCQNIYFSKWNSKNVNPSSVLKQCVIHDLTSLNIKEISYYNQGNMHRAGNQKALGLFPISFFILCCSCWRETPRINNHHCLSSSL